MGGCLRNGGKNGGLGLGRYLKIICKGVLHSVGCAKWVPRPLRFSHNVQTGVGFAKWNLKGLKLAIADLTI